MHANARLNLHGRRLLIDRIQQGRPVAHVADELGISRQTAYKWWGRWRREGDIGLRDRSSRPRSFPNQTSRQLERRVEVLRRKRKLGPARIAGILDMPASTVHQVLCRQGLNRLDWMDRPSGTVIRRQIVHDRPGEQVQIDVKKLGRIPPGGGWRAWGRGNVVDHRATKVGYAFVHTAIDSHTRLAYSEVLADEKAVTAIGFYQRAHAWFAGTWHRDRSRPNRQRCLLQVVRVPRRGRSQRSSPSSAAATTTRLERQSRTVQPHPRRRMGLHPDLPLGRCPDRRACPMAASLQPSPTPHRHRRPTHEPNQQRSWAAHLGTDETTSSSRGGTRRRLPRARERDPRAHRDPGGRVERGLLTMARLSQSELSGFRIGTSSEPEAPDDAPRCRDATAEHTVPGARKRTDRPLPATAAEAAPARASLGPVPAAPTRAELRYKIGLTLPLELAEQVRLLTAQGYAIADLVVVAYQHQRDRLLDEHEARGPRRLLRHPQGRSPVTIALAHAERAAIDQLAQRLGCSRSQTAAALLERHLKSGPLPR